jgi:hypothetical protein
VTESEDFSRSRPNTGGAHERTEAERFRTRASRALALARDVTDQEAARALKAHAADLLGHAADLLEKAEAIERQGET